MTNCSSCGDDLPHSGPKETGCDPDNVDVWEGPHWPRVTVILVSQQQKMDQEDQALLGVIKSYEEQEYQGPLDLNIILRPTCDQRLSDDHLRAVGVKQADPGIVMFWDDQTLQAPNHVEIIAREFVEAWPEQVTVTDVDSDRLTACTQGHYMREIYGEVMK